MPVIMLKTLTFKSSVSFGIHTLIDKSFGVLQLATYLSNLTKNEKYWNSWLYSLEFNIPHFWLFSDIHFIWLDPLIRPLNNPINIF